MMIKRPGLDVPSNFMRKVQSVGMADGFMKKGSGVIRGVTLPPQRPTGGPVKNTLERPSK